MPNMLRSVIYSAGGVVLPPAVTIADVFSVDLWTGDGSAKTITNGLDLLNEGGMVQHKLRESTVSHSLHDTERGLTNELVTNTDAAEGAGRVNNLTAVNSNGYDVGTNWSINTFTSVGFSFRNSPRFLHIITYTGDGVNNRKIPHNLGVTPGRVVVKNLDQPDRWAVQHISRGGTKYLQFDKSDAELTLGMWNDSNANVNNVTLGDGDWGNVSGEDYIMYVFAHDDRTDGVIHCGGYEGDGTTDGSQAITLGWRPQYVEAKRATGGTGSWLIADTTRGILSPGTDQTLAADSNATETTLSFDWITLTATGFEIVSANAAVNNSGDDYIFMAIREE